MTALDLIDQIDAYSANSDVHSMEAILIGRQLVVAPVVMLALNVASAANEAVGFMWVLEAVEVVSIQTAAARA